MGGGGVGGQGWRSRNEGDRFFRHARVPSAPPLSRLCLKNRLYSARDRSRAAAKVSL